MIVRKGRQPGTRPSTKPPSKKQPPFPGPSRPGLSTFERELWHDVVVVMIEEGVNSSAFALADAASDIVLKYREFEKKMRA